MVKQIGKRRMAELNNIANDLFRAITPKTPKSWCADPVSICEEVARHDGPELTLEEGTIVETFLYALKEEKLEKEHAIECFIVMDCRCASPFEPQHIKAFRKTAEGEQLADDTFREWVTDAVGATPLTAAEMENVLSDGYYEMGEGFIAKIETNC